MENVVIAKNSSPLDDHITSAPPSSLLPLLPHKRAARGWRSVKYSLVYLQIRFNMDGIQLVNVFNIWSGSTNVTPLFGAFLSDAYLGRFRTLLLGSMSSFLGMAILALIASIPKLRPLDYPGESNCQKPQDWQLAVLYFGLGLLAMGAGGVRPCNIAFGADQFDTRTEKGRAQLESLFNWWYFSFIVALVVALTAVVYVQTNVSWVISYAIPAICRFCSIIVFLIGKHTYIITKPQGTIFDDMAKVIVAAHQHVVKLTRTDMLKFLDKVALIADPSELDDNGLPKRIGCFITMDQMNTFGLMQAIQSNNEVHKFKIPPGWMGLMSMICLSVWIFVYEQIYLPRVKKRSKKNIRLTMRQRINVGIVMAILCMVVAVIVEKNRREAFALSGLNEAFAAVAFMEDYNNHLPETMRTLAGAIFFLSFSASSHFNTAIVNLVHHVTSNHGTKPP
ncbi:unnamed protein product [Dovyalis caffra]|uniref:Uncharacterized protein n=1 Tax=Dovyalis caffra TaxID=77055 RepID=A0AAV1S2T7_9ROSI|nr:unnamed protein product [Dovyalis caffra]